VQEIDGGDFTDEPGLLLTIDNQPYEYRSESWPEGTGGIAAGILNEITNQGLDGSLQGFVFGELPAIPPPEQPDMPVFGASLQRGNLDEQSPLLERSTLERSTDVVLDSANSDSLTLENLDSNQCDADSSTASTRNSVLTIDENALTENVYSYLVDNGGLCPQSNSAEEMNSLADYASKESVDEQASEQAE
jgi:hypothetical protein